MIKLSVNKMLVAFIAFSIGIIIAVGSSLYASSITTINGSDTISGSRTTINTNFSNLNTDKLENNTLSLITFGRYTSTSSIASIFPFASTTAITVSGNAYIGTLNTTSGTSTFSNGIVLNTGCIYVNGGCLSLSGSGTVTSVTLATPNSTLSLGGTNPVTTSGTINVDIDLTHANTWTGKQTIGNASTTLLSVNGNMVSGERYPVWGYGATTTTWTGTTTENKLIARFGGTLKSVICSTNVGTLNVQAKVNSTSVTPMFSASTTKGTVTFNGSNTFVAGDVIEFDFGTPATAPTSINCSGLATGF